MENYLPTIIFVIYIFTFLIKTFKKKPSNFIETIKNKIKDFEKKIENDYNIDQKTTEKKNITQPYPKPYIQNFSIKKKIKPIKKEKKIPTNNQIIIKTKNNRLFNNSSDLKKGIILSEILSPCRAKRRISGRP